MKEITKDCLEKGYQDYLTVGDLKEFLYKHNLPNDANVLIQRVEDTYYENHGWGVYLKEGDFESMNQYHPAWCCVKYNDEDKTLFIDLHY